MSLTWPYEVRLRGFHPLWRAIPGDLTFTHVGKKTTPTSPSLSSQDSACPIPFSFATTHGISLISIPPPTKMLQFGGFPIASRLIPKYQEVPFSHLRIQDIHASPRSFSQLVTTFFGTRAKRSSSWVVASHVCTCTMRDNPSLSSHANAASSEDRLPEGRPSSALPPTRTRAEVLSNPPTCLLYMNPSGCFNAPESAPVPRSGGGTFHHLSSIVHSGDKTTLVRQMPNGRQQAVNSLDAAVHGHGKGKIVHCFEIST